MAPFTEVDRLCVNTLRTLSVDMVQRAESGHPGLPLGAAPMAYVLWQRHLRHAPTAPTWFDRDRFVLSPGHGSALLYSLLHLTGYALSRDDLLAFRQWDSKTPGHPEFGLTPGVEATTGPLGQGHANAVGMAIAERALANRFNAPGFELVDHFTYCLLGDGDVMEGVTAEAASLAGHLRLGKLVCLYDSNDVTLDGPAALSMSEDVGRRYESYGWQVLHVRDGDADLEALDRALAAARAETTRPSLIIVKTTIGFGSPNKAGKAASHGSPLGPGEVAATKQALGWPPEATFLVPLEAEAHLRSAVDRGRSQVDAWEALRARYAEAHPARAEELARAMAGEWPAGLFEGLPEFPVGVPVETRTAAGKVQNALAARWPQLLGGDADLGGSTKTVLAGAGSFDGQSGAGRNIHYGVREHAMAAIANGIAYHGGLRTFTATFFCFVDYMRPALRLAAMNRLPVIYVLTHDSVGLGEDGPTHQPVEHLMSLRVMPNVAVVRPADAAESVEAWRFAVERRDGPTALVLSRQKLPVFDRAALGPAVGLHRGAYVLAEASGGAPAAIVIGTGSEVQWALEARAELERSGVPTRVVSMPCVEAFRRQDRAYRDAVLPPAVTARVSIEAGVTLGWEAWVGARGVALGIDRFGASAPEPVLMAKLGMSAASVVAAVRTLL